MAAIGGDWPVMGISRDQRSGRKGAVGRDVVRSMRQEAADRERPAGNMR